MPAWLLLGRAAGVHGSCWQKQCSSLWDAGLLPVSHRRCFFPWAAVTLPFILLGLAFLMSSESVSRQSTWGACAGNASIFKLFFLLC